jgi:RHS repeat-associated protein
LNHVVNQTDALGTTTHFDYDQVGNLIVAQDGKGHQTTFSYDGQNRLSIRTDAVGHQDQRFYDLTGTLVQFNDRRAKVILFTYDALNRLVNENYDFSSSVSRIYDANGRLTHVVDSLSGNFDYSYDLAGRLLSTSNQFGHLEYTYDKDSRLVSRAVSGDLPVHYSYDDVGNLLSAVLPRISPALSSQNVSAGFSYDADNRLSKITRSNGVSSAYAYDAASNLLSITHAGGAGINIPLIYTYDAMGNRTSFANPLAQGLITQPVSSTFDNANRLISSTSSADATAYSFDANGNLTSVTDPTGATTYNWDARNRLASITQPNGQQTRFQYDWSFNLLEQTDAGPGANLTEQFLLDPLTNIARLTRSNGDGLSVLAGTAIDQDLAVLHDNGQVEYSLKDGINSTVETVDDTGKNISSFQYEPFGKTTTTGLYPLRFTGRLPLFSDLYYNRARYYSPTTGRFISEDPVGLPRGDFNGYRYAANQPTQLNDPLGLDPYSLDVSTDAVTRYQNRFGFAYGGLGKVLFYEFEHQVIDKITDLILPQWLLNADKLTNGNVLDHFKTAIPGNNPDAVSKYLDQQRQAYQCSLDPTDPACSQPKPDCP